MPYVNPSSFHCSQQIRFDEGIQVTVQDGVDIAFLVFGAVVLDEAVRLQDVRADLAAPGNILLGIQDFLGFFLTFIFFQLIEPGL